MIRALIFDFNGVLVDDEPIHFELLQRVLLEEGIELDEDSYYREYIGYDDRGCFQRALSRAGRSPQETDILRLVTRKASYYRDRIRRDGYPFFPGAVDLVHAASAMTLALVSGALREEIEGALEQERVLDRFKTIVAAEDVKSSKPDPEGYERAVQELNSLPPLPQRLFHPHEIVAIEDTPAGLEAATATGLLTVGLTQPHSAEALAAADLVFAAIGDIDLDQLQTGFADLSRA